MEEVVTPGGTCREVLVRQSFDHLVDNPEGLFRDPVCGKRTDMVPSMRSVPPELPDSIASKQQLADEAAPAGRKAASGQLTEALVAQAISNAGELAALYLVKPALCAQHARLPVLFRGSERCCESIVCTFFQLPRPCRCHALMRLVREVLYCAGLKLESPSISSEAANPFATIRAVVTPAVPASRHARPPLHDEVRMRQRFAAFHLLASVISGPAILCTSVCAQHAAQCIWRTSFVANAWHLRGVQGAAAKAQGAAARAASESDDVARPGKGLTEAPDLQRISDPSPHSSASGSASGSPLGAARCAKGPARSTAPSEGPQVLNGGSSGHASTVQSPQNGVRDGRKPQGSPQDGEFEKAKSGCWCF